tara:strand:- start:678 stop:989 length:312 start_codon:yes stop_codon:yes gene_type:complete
MNKIVKLLVIVVLAYYLYSCYCKKKTGVSKKKSGGNVVLYGRMSCPYTVQMRKALDESDVSYKYIEITEEHDIPAVPHIKNPSNGKSVTGAMPVGQLKKELSV